MGIFDGLKAVTNALTGGAAKVYLDVPNFSLREPFQVTVRAQIHDADINCNRIYLKIRGIEEVRVPDQDDEYNSEGVIESRTEIVKATHISIERVFTIANKQVLNANQNYEWTMDITLPSSAPNIFRGWYCKHTYQAFAGIDAFGNDPDSGWIELTL